MAAADRRDDERRRVGAATAVVLGVPSLGLGLVGLVAPRWSARVVGLPATPAGTALARLLGLRETVVAVAFLTRRRPRWLAGFLAQDALDLPWLTLAALRGPGDRSRLRRTLLVYLGMAVVDVLTALRHRPDRDARDGPAPRRHRPAPPVAGGPAGR